MTQHEEETPGGETPGGQDTAPMEQVGGDEPDQDSEPSLNAPEEGRPDGTVDQ